MNKEEPKVLTRMRLSCCWGDNLNEKELNEVVDYINLLQQKVNQLKQENQQLKERIEYYYEFDEELKKEDLPEELRPYYKNQDCCRYIVELRKENKELKDKVNQLETNIDEAIEILKLCNSQCSKEAISKLERGKE